jgi:dihydrofolate reductase
MGRNTFLSLPVRPLPNRRNIVITDIPQEQFEGCEIATSVEEAMYLTAEEEEVFIMGGGSIYKQFLKHADRLYLTKVHASFEADTYFPEFNFDEWNELKRERHEASENNPYPFTFLVFERKK